MSQTNNTSISHAGLDIAKDSLVLDFKNRIHNFLNDTKGRTKLVKLLTTDPQVHVIMEASGGYEKPVAHALHCAQITLSIVNAARPRSFAFAKGLRAKTDPIDAAVLTAFGEAIDPQPTPKPTEIQLRIGELVTRRRQLTETVVSESNRSDHYCDPLSREQACVLLKLLRQQIKECDQAIASLIASDEETANRYKRLQEVAGVGAVTAATLIAEMPELGSLSDEAAAALAGLAPFNRDSGPLKGTRSIAGGRSSIRCALYMAAMSAKLHDPILKTFYERLIHRGKKPIVALTAVMRKLIILLNRLIKNPNFKLSAA